MAITLNLIVIRSPDIDRAAEFYRALGLTLEKHRHANGPLHYVADVGGVVFEIYPRRGEEDNTCGVRLGFQVTSVEAAVTAAETAGGHVVSPPQFSQWGFRAVVDDPDGHRIELTEPATPLEG
jgi:lactoylglutathione lyase